ncbi:MAG: DUF1176 domain-containing protein [Rhodobacteraceae bacterium]|nr:DUF1176 domain-containing protein [Paracoccaceae bacterium]
MPRIRLIAAFAIAAGLPVSAQDIAQSLRYWHVACDAERTCTAEVAGFSSDNDGVTLSIRRTSQPDNGASVTIREEIGMYEGIRVELDAPGIFNAMGGNITGSDVVHAITFAQNPDDVLLDGFRRVTGVIVRIHYGGEMGSVEYRVPMNGAVDAMMFMDIAQERVGRVDALVARGPFPSDDPSDPYPYLNDEEEGEPELAQGDDGAADEHMEDGPNGSYIDLLVDTGRIPDQVLMPGYRMFDCPGFQDTIANHGVLVNRDETTRKTFVVPCNIGKANVQAYVVMHDPDRGVTWELMEFQEPPAMNNPNRGAVLNPVWNAYDQTMTITRFGNINRNCGAYEVHEWVPGENFFELVEYREKKGCGGAQVQPQDFPLTWSIDEMGD